VGRFRAWIGVLALCTVLSAACSDPTAMGGPAGSPGASPTASLLPLVLSGSVLHAGDYCHFLQVVEPGDNTLPVEQGCLFNLTKPADVFGTDAQDYSVSEVVGEAQLAVRGPNDAKVMIVCRLSPRAAFWFWVSADGHWNISNAADVHHPQDLVSTQDEQSLRQYVNVGGKQNHVQFHCGGGLSAQNVSLALNVNGRQFAAVTVPMPDANVPLERPATPWFVDVGARLISPGTLEGTAAAVTLYDHE
jgi:hypothetical protein